MVSHLSEIEACSIIRHGGGVAYLGKLILDGFSRLAAEKEIEISPHDQMGSEAKLVSGTASDQEAMQHAKRHGALGSRALIDRGGDRS